jgi:SagB-type dehydrogenase family enzyme
METALRYHEATNHSQAKLRRDSHVLDWSNQPRPFKIYRDVESVALPTDPAILAAATQPLLDLMGTPPTDTGDPGVGERIPDLDMLTRTLYLAAGVIKRKRLAGGGEMRFRAYPNTGALYHIDLYLVTGELPGLAAGVYHFGPHDFVLHRLRAGDYRAVLAEASGVEARIARAPAVLVSASTYWRNAWKYQARAYRHCFWDAGTLHANLLAAADAELLQPRVVLGFADARVAALLGLDAMREAPLTLVPLGGTETPIPSAPPMPTLALPTEALSRSEVDYPTIREMQAASSLVDRAAVAAWRSPLAIPPAERTDATLLPLASIGDAELTQRSLVDVIRKRGSTRAFDRTCAIAFGALCTVLDRATRGVAADVIVPGSTLLDHYLIVHAVDGLAPGAYYYQREERALELLRKGDFRAMAARLDLGQALAGDAAVNVYSLCSLPVVLGQLGNRGYRAAQLEGGITGGRMYLAAYAQGFGATGLTFFDDEVTEFFSPHAAGKSVMFLVALGYPDRVALGLDRER